MKTNEEKIKILMDNFYNKETNTLNLSGLDCRDMNIDLSYIEAINIYNYEQKANCIWNDNQKATKNIINNNQQANNIWNDNQKKIWFCKECGKDKND